MFYHLAIGAGDAFTRPASNVAGLLANCAHWRGKFFFRRSGGYVEYVNAKTGEVHDHCSLKIFYHYYCALKMMLKA